jgi:hypothetical protein
VRAHFDLPEDPWRPCQPCAFDAESRALLGELVLLGRAGRDADARARARAALDPGGGL